MNADQVLGLAAVLITVLLVLAAAIESVLETLRGFTGKLIPSLKGAMSLDEALKQAREFSDANGELEARLIAIKAAAERINYSIQTSVTSINAIAGQAAAAPGAPGASVTHILNDAANEVSSAIGDYERHRILILRVLSAAIGIGLAFLSGIDLLDFVGAAPGLGSLQVEEGPFQWVGEVITGVAASGGSSFWHDKLDRVRSVKNINQQLAALMR